MSNCNDTCTDHVIELFHALRVFKELKTLPVDSFIDQEDLLYLSRIIDKLDYLASRVAYDLQFTLEFIDQLPESSSISWGPINGSIGSLRPFMGSDIELDDNRLKQA